VFNLVEITRHTILQDLGFTHIQDGTVLVEELINACLFWQRL
jgi:hypothetical protein